MKNILLTINKLLENYLGIDVIQVIPHTIKKRGKAVLVLNTESFKRHVSETPFIQLKLDSMSNTNKEKLGKAIGKIVADNLVISFEPVLINKEELPHA